MNNESMNGSAPQDQQTTAVSIFEQAGSGDFPVLKAFQEYIDAEQAKARKRMIWLSAFFIVLLVAVVVTFAMVMAIVINRDQQNLSSIANRNQELSDKLLDMAFRERVSAQPVVTVQQPAPQPIVQPAPVAQSQDSALKPMLERLERLAQALQAQPRQPVQQPPPGQQIRPAPASPSHDQVESFRLQEELRRQREVIKAEREKLKAEQERLHQEEVERQRRRLYPEYYARKAAEEAEKKHQEELKLRKDDERAVEEKTREQTSAPSPIVEEKAPSIVKNVPAPKPPKPAVDDAKTPTARAQEKPVVAPLLKDESAPLPTSAKPVSKPVEKTKTAPQKEMKPDAKPRPVVPAAKPVNLKKDKPISYFEETEDDLEELSKSSSTLKETSADASSKKPTEESLGKKPEEKPVAKTERKPTEEKKVAPDNMGKNEKTEMLKVGSGKNEIPFLIELPEAGK